MKFKILKFLNLNVSGVKTAVEVKWKTFFLVLKVLFYNKKAKSQKYIISGINFKYLPIKSFILMNFCTIAMFMKSYIKNLL